MRRTPHGGSGSWFALVELLKLQESGQFSDESVKIEVTQTHSRRPVVLEIADKGNSVRGVIIIVSTYCKTPSSVSSFNDFLFIIIKR